MSVWHLAENKYVVFFFNLQRITLDVIIFVYFFGSRAEVLIFFVS